MPDMTRDEIAAAKAALRPVVAALRRAIPADVAAVAAVRLCEHGMRTLVASGVVAAYHPLPGELDPLPLFDALLAAGAAGALPAVIGPSQPLEFRAWRPGEPLERGAFGTRQPAAPAALRLPDLLLVPLLAFDRRRHRLGYGAGFYDRSIAELRRRKPVRVVGIGFAAQEVPEVPADGWDEPLDLVLTEAGVV
jgi:5-formyltetrahydrofolate cyclo-ligase